MEAGTGLIRVRLRWGALRERSRERNESGLRSLRRLRPRPAAARKALRAVFQVAAGW